MGWEVGQRFKKGGHMYNLWLVRVTVWQKPRQHCKAIILQLKINKITCHLLTYLICLINCPNNRNIYQLLSCSVSAKTSKLIKPDYSKAGHRFSKDNLLSFSYQFIELWCQNLVCFKDGHLAMFLKIQRGKKLSSLSFFFIFMILLFFLAE